MPFVSAARAGIRRCFAFPRLIAVRAEDEIKMLGRAFARVRKLWQSLDKLSHARCFKVCSSEFHNHSPVVQSPQFAQQRRLQLGQNSSPCVGCLHHRQNRKPPACCSRNCLSVSLGGSGALAWGALLWSSLLWGMAILLVSGTASILRHVQVFPIASS